MDFSETKQADRDASEYHPNHCHTDRGGSKTHPIHPPADSYQHTVLKAGCISNLRSIVMFNHVTALNEHQCFSVGRAEQAPTKRKLNG